MRNIFLRACFAATCLFSTACEEEAPPIESVEQRALHGSASIIAEHLITIPENEPLLIESSSFQRYFKRLGRIELSDSVVVGSISSIEIDADGRILILDPRQHQVFLFASNGEFLRELSAESCDPGLQWSPFGIAFSNTGEIYVTQNGPRHVVFNSSGLCDHVNNDVRAMSQANVFTAEQDVFMFVRKRDAHSINHYDRNGNLIRKIGDSQRQRNFISRFSAGNLIQDSSGRLFHLFPTSPLVQIYDPEGVDLGIIGSVPDIYRMYTDDLADDLQTPDLMTAMSAIMREYSLSLYMHLLDEDILLVQSTNGFEDVETSDRARMLQIVSTSGDMLTPEPIYLGPSEQYIVGARDGLLYYTRQPETDESGDWGNQGLEVYQFIRPSVRVLQ